MDELQGGAMTPKFRAWDKKHKEICEVLQIHFDEPHGSGIKVHKSINNRIIIYRRKLLWKK